MYLLKVLGVLILALLGCVLLIAFVPPPTMQLQVDLTRYLASSGAAFDGRPESFNATPGAGRLFARRDCSGGFPRVLLNGQAMSFDSAARNMPLAQVAVPLQADNMIAVSVASSERDCTSIRVKQLADIETHVLSRVHFNTNVSDFTAAREFYGRLGFTTLSGFPDANTQAMARAIGVDTPTAYDGSQGGEAGGYLLHGELVGPAGFAGGVIDLIEFTIPRDDAPPYASVNHLGMARATMHTADLDTDYQYLMGLGVEFLSAPVARADGTRFAVFKDLDGTFYELQQAAGEVAAGRLTQISKLAQVHVNVSDLERSQAWYQLLGYDLETPRPRSESLAVARALGLSAVYDVDAVLLRHVWDDSLIEVTQWLAPFDPEPPYPVPINHLGIHRMAFSTSDIDADVAMLRAQGVTFVSEVTPCCAGDDSSGRIVAFYDPDGTILELVEQPFMTPLLTFTGRLQRWF